VITEYFPRSDRDQMLIEASPSQTLGTIGHYGSGNGTIIRSKRTIMHCSWPVISRRDNGQ